MKKYMIILLVSICSLSTGLAHNDIRDNEQRFKFFLTEKEAENHGICCSPCRKFETLNVGTVDFPMWVVHCMD